MKTYLKTYPNLGEFYIISNYKNYGILNYDKILAQYLNISLKQLHNIYNKYDTYNYAYRNQNSTTFFRKQEDVLKAVEELQKYELMSHLIGIESVNLLI